MRIIATILLVGWGLLFLGRAAYLQIARGSYFRGVAEGNRIRMVTVPARRGLMYDRNGEIIAANVPSFVLAVRPIDIPLDPEDQQRLFAVLAEFDIDAAALQTVITQNKRSGDWISVQEPIDQQKAIQLIAAVQNLPGISVRTETRREYALERSQSLAHVLGYVGRPTEKDIASYAGVGRPQIVGKAGLEASYEEAIRGVNGQKQVEVDALGNEQEVLSQQEAKDGDHLVLALDAQLQEVAEIALQGTLTRLKKKKGAVVVMDPRSGEVRALVSLPSYDSNRFGAGMSREEYAALAADPDHPLFPRAVSGIYPSGSTIKPIFAVAALAEGIITPRTTILSVGGISVGQWRFPDWRAGGHGATNVYHAIADSVNTFFYYIGGGYQQFEGLGPERLAKWARIFGFGKVTGIDIPSEASGFVPTPAWKHDVFNETWYIGDTYHFAIGQGDFSATPIQIANATAAIANDGTLFAPHIVHALLHADGTETLLSPTILQKFVAPIEDLRVVQNAMRQTVTAGSARSLADLPAAVAGKTGTAQWSSVKPPHAWFTGFGPVENPELVITVLIEEGLEGSTAATPIAKEIFTWYFENRTQ